VTKKKKGEVERRENRGKLGGKNPEKKKTKRQRVREGTACRFEKKAQEGLGGGYEILTNEIGVFKRGKSRPS